LSGCQAGVYLATPADAEPTDRRSLGEHADRQSKLEYAGQLEYRFAERWSVAALAFGEIEDLAQCAGVLFGLTDASADATVRVMFAMEY
jgi:hypothetical protein